MKLVRKAEWDSLVARIELLEKREVPVPTIRSGYIGGSGLYGPPRYRVMVTHQDLLLKILAHLGLDIEPVYAAPADVKLVTKPKLP